MMTTHRGSVTLYIPVDRDGLDVIYRKFILKQVDVNSVSGEGSVAYVFYDRARFYLGTKRVPPFKIREGSFVAIGERVPLGEEFTFGLPVKDAMRVVSAEHYVSGSLRVHHTRLLLK